MTAQMRAREPKKGVCLDFVLLPCYPYLCISSAIKKQAADDSPVVSEAEQEDIYLDDYSTRFVHAYPLFLFICLTSFCNFTVKHPQKPMNLMWEIGISICYVPMKVLSTLGVSAILF
jgi:hypothetical protein